ncbi:MAG: hypothetical protein JNK60_15005, partial [Acidobacteria bacterium]|nr:hypothetical protein [Acidobacteriota bacterium]
MPLRALLLLCVLATGLGAEDVDPVAHARLAFRLHTGKDGLPQNSITALHQDRRGTVWAGTEDGVAFSNGRAFTRVVL